MKSAHINRRKESKQGSERLLPGLIAAFFAFPFGKDQPTEVWALAKIRFLFKPRRRIWDQSGAKELVTVTVPKKLEEHRTNGLSEHEVQSRLSALASTIDSRGWAIKNVNVNLYAQPGAMDAAISSDRLIDMSSLPQEVPSYDVQASDDILDPHNNPIAQQFDQMITASTQAHHQQLVSMMGQAPTAAPDDPTLSNPDSSPPNNYWFLNQTPVPTNLKHGQAVFTSTQVVAPGSDDQNAVSAQPTAEELAVAARLMTEDRQPPEAYAHMKTIMPIEDQIQQTQQLQAPMSITPIVPPLTTAVQNKQTTVSPTTQRLANNNDLTVATIAREANRSSNTEHFGDDEVVISLH